MTETIQLICNWIILISAVFLAITNISKFLGHPIKFFKNKQTKDIDERVLKIIKDENLKGDIVDSIKKELCYNTDFSKKALEQILPTLEEIKKINLDQNQRIDILFDSSKDILREKIMGIYHANKTNRTLKIYEKEALDQYYSDYKKEKGNSYIDRYYKRMSSWEVINSTFDCNYDDDD